VQKRTIFLATFCLWAVAAGTARADTSASDIKAATATFLQGWASEQEAANNYRVEFSVGNIDSRLTLAECPTPLATVFTGDPLLTTSPTIEISCAGNRPWRMFVTSTVSIFGPALVAARPLARGERISKDMLMLQETRINASRRGVLRDAKQISGMLLRRPINTGSPITPDLLDAPNAVERGDHVIITARSRTFSVSSRGRAMANASVGEQVMVENLQSSRTVRAMVTAPGRVEIPM